MVTPPENMEVKQRNATTTAIEEDYSATASTPKDENNQNKPTSIPIRPPQSTFQNQQQQSKPSTTPQNTYSSTQLQGGTLSSNDQSPSSSTSQSFPILTDQSYKLNALKSDAELSQMTQIFSQQHCDLTHVKAWYPTDVEDSWQQRAPYFIIAGVWNSGIGPLTNALLRHPQIDAAKTNGFFLPKQFNRYYSYSQSSALSRTASNTTISTPITATTATSEILKIKVFAARERMYAQAYSPSSLRDSASPPSNNSSNDTTTKITSNKYNDKNIHVAMDVSPGLLFHAHTTSHSILCVSPWAKIVILLRNPVDRVYQQWVYSKINLGLPLSLEDWMAQEMKVMQSVGLIGGDNDEDATSQPISEREAWNKYQSVRNVGGAIGRSLYVLQLEDWIKTYVEAGKKPAEEIIILASENIEEKPALQYSNLIDFLGLAPLNITNRNLNLGKPSPPKGMEPMKEETRQMLQQFFQPYNERLFTLLKSNGFQGNWETIWQP
jgi:hypothetical protein